MDINTIMSGAEQAQTQARVDMVNAALDNKRVSKDALDKDDFLKILITQLSHQDPTAPMQDKEFIAQMAQFSSLEQMTNMSNQFSQLSGMLQSGQAISMIGRNVEIGVGEMTVAGIVEEVKGNEFPQLLVNGRYYDLEDVEKVKD